MWQLIVYFQIAIASWQRRIQIKSEEKDFLKEIKKKGQKKKKGNKILLRGKGTLEGGFWRINHHFVSKCVCALKFRLLRCAALSRIEYFSNKKIYITIQLFTHDMLLSLLLLLLLLVADLLPKIPPFLSWSLFFMILLRFSFWLPARRWNWVIDTTITIEKE